jgi:putative mRNA 3-end processing factor
MRLDFLGAAGEVGRSAVLLETDKRILLDCGVKIFGKEHFPRSPGSVDAVIVSHAHLDHSGFLPSLYKKAKPACVATPPTHDLTALLVADSMRLMEYPFGEHEFKRSLKAQMPVPYETEMTIGKSTATMYDAGHIPGAAMVEIFHDEKSVLYTGDFKTSDTQMHPGAKQVKDVDALIIESTYADREHPDRQEAEKFLYSRVAETVDNGGTALLPAFALGRSQEIVRILRSLDEEIPIFMDGMGREVTDIVMLHSQYVRDFPEFRDAMRSIEYVAGPSERRKALAEPAVVVTTAGMMEGGPVLDYILKLNEKSRVIFTGYSVEGTNGWRLRHSGKIMLGGKETEIRQPVDYVDLSAHAGKSELFDFVRRSGAQKVFCIHGDRCPEFAEGLKKEGFDAVAPKAGDSFEI